MVRKSEKKPVQSFAIPYEKEVELFIPDVDDESILTDFYNRCGASKD